MNELRLEKANFAKWLSMPTWRTWEALMLLCNFEPGDGSLCYDLLTKYRHEVIDENHAKILFYHEVLVRAIKAGDLPGANLLYTDVMDVSARPGVFLRIMRANNLEIPDELRKIKSAQLTKNQVWRLWHPVWWAWCILKWVWQHKVISIIGSTLLTLLTLLAIDYHLAWQHAILIRQFLKQAIIR